MQVTLSAIALCAFGAGTAMAHRIRLLSANAAGSDSKPGCWLRPFANVRAHFLTSPKAPDDSWALKMGCVQGAEELVRVLHWRARGPALEGS